MAPDPHKPTTNKPTNNSLGSVLNSPFKHSSFSKNQLTIFILVFAALGGYLIYRSFATAPLVATLEAEQMSLPAGASVVTDSVASGGKAIKLSYNGTATGSVIFPATVTSLNVTARGTQCNGSPWMKLDLDGVKVIGTHVAGSWTSYTYTPSTAYKAGGHTLAISFTNDYKKSTCDRNLYADVTSFYGPIPAPTPAPTVSLSATPTSLIAGSSSTLTWNSTNATSCAASGAWSGAQPTTGSISTGALNQTSTYNLSCSGSGGSGSASVIVSVSPGFTTSLKQGMTLTTPYAWTFNPGVASVKGYFFADGKALATPAPDASGGYSFTIQSNTLTAGAHTLGHAWDLADGTHQTGPANYSVTVSVGSGTGSNLGSKLPPRLPLSSGASHIFVAPNGNDSNSGTISSPVQSLAKAVSLAISGTFIEVRGNSGAFTAPSQIINSHCSFLATNPVTIRTYPGDPQAVFASTDTSRNNVYFGNCAGMRVQNLTLASPYGISGIKIDSSVNFELSNNLIGPNGGSGVAHGSHGILVSSAASGIGTSTITTNLQILNNTVFNWYGDATLPNNNHGMYLSEGDKILVANNVLYNAVGGAGYGIQLGGETNNSWIVNNTLDGITSNKVTSFNGGGIVVWGSLSEKTQAPTNNNIIKNNLFTNEQVWAVGASGSTPGPLTVVTNNLAYNNGSADYQPFYGSNQLFTCGGTCPGLNLPNANPLYVNRTGHDFRLSAGSPAIGKSDPDYTPAYDHDGKSRSTSPTLGAYEF